MSTYMRISLIKKVDVLQLKMVNGFNLTLMEELNMKQTIKMVKKTVYGEVILTLVFLEVKED